MAVDFEEMTQDASIKIMLLANLFSQPGDLVLNENDKAGLVSIFYDLIEDISEPNSMKKAR